MGLLKTEHGYIQYNEEWSNRSFLNQQLPAKLKGAVVYNTSFTICRFAPEVTDVTFINCQFHETHVPGGCRIRQFKAEVAHAGHRAWAGVARFFGFPLEKVVRHDRVD